MYQKAFIHTVSTRSLCKKRGWQHLFLPLLTTLFLFVGSVNTSAQVSFKIEAPTSVTLSDKIVVRFILTNGEGMNFKNPEVEGVSTLFPPSKATAKGEFNGKPSTTYTGTYLAEKAGIIRIGSAEVQVKGKVYKTKPISIKVLPQEKNEKTASSSSSSTFFIRTIPSKRTVYRQEGMLVSYKIYARSSRFQFEQSKFPEYDGFVEEEINNSSQSQLTMERYNGQNYYTGIIRQSIIIPQQSGELVIPQGEINLTVALERTVDNEEEFFESSSTPTIAKKLLTPAVKINVLELPQPAPSGFDGAVGSFDIKAELSDKNTIKTDEPFLLRVTISGEGNLKLLTPPSFVLPESFEIFDQSTDFAITTTTEGIKGSRIIEYQIIPHNVGTFSIPSLSLVYFDPEKKSYLSKQTQEISFSVIKGSAAGYEAKASNDLNLYDNDIAGLQEKELYNKSLTQFLYSPLYWSLYLLLLLIVLAAGWGYNLHRQSLNDVVGRKYKKAGKIITQELKSLQATIEKGDKGNFYALLLSAIYGYLSNKFHLSTSQLSSTLIRETFQNNYTQDIVEELLKILQQAEYARYASGEIATSPLSLIERTLNVVQRIESKQ